MATPIIINPTQPSQVVVNGTQKSGTPIQVMTDLDYKRVQSMIDEAVGDVNIDTTDLAKEQTLTDGINTLSSKIDNIDLTPIENKVDEGVSALSTKIDNIDLSSVAKQGENQEATNSKILEEVAKIPNLKNIYSARFEKNDDNINTYTMILPIIAGVEGDTIIL